MKTRSINGKTHFVIEVPMTPTLFASHLAYQIPHAFPDGDTNTFRMLHLVRTLPWTMLNDTVAQSIGKWGNDVEIIGGTEIESKIESILEQRLKARMGVIRD